MLYAEIISAISIISKCQTKRSEIRKDEYRSRSVASKLTPRVRIEHVIAVAQKPPSDAFTRKTFINTAGIYDCRRLLLKYRAAQPRKYRHSQNLFPMAKISNLIINKHRNMKAGICMTKIE